MCPNGLSVSAPQLYNICKSDFLHTFVFMESMASLISKRITHSVVQIRTSVEEGGERGSEFNAGLRCCGGRREKVEDGIRFRLVYCVIGGGGGPIIPSLSYAAARKGANCIGRAAVALIPDRAVHASPFRRMTMTMLVIEVWSFY